MMYLCLKTGDSMALTVGHVYEAEAFHGYGLRVRDDNANLNVYAADRFSVASLDDAWNTTHYLDGRVSPMMQKGEPVPTPSQEDLVQLGIEGGLTRLAHEAAERQKQAKAVEDALTAKRMSLDVAELRVKASAEQVGGEHYKSAAIQPAEFAEKNGLSFLEGNVVKRVFRHSRGGKGREDLEKAIHELRLLLELHY